MNLQGAEPVDVGTLIVVAAALVLSLFAVAYSKRSADAARESVRRERERAESRHVRWEITGGWSGNEVGYELLNRGSSTAHHVRLFLPPGSGGLTIHRRGGLDVRGGASVSFTIRGPVSAADISDVTDTVGNVPKYALGSMVGGASAARSCRRPCSWTALSATRRSSSGSRGRGGPGRDGRDRP
uniref:hypothetical protein n=1 Tax=Kocuria sp. TaxID=1871328 RepID=UPI002810AC2A